MPNGYPSIAITRPSSSPPATRLAVAAAIVASTLAGCTSGNDKNKEVSRSVFAVKPGECFQAPGKVRAELSSITRTPCDQPHSQEAYAIVAYQVPAGASPDVYPGNAALTNFAQGKCAQLFGSYVGVDYLDSKLFFTFLLPSARSWQQENDRNVVCFVTATDAILKASVKGSKR